MVKLLLVVGKKNSGKTTFMERIIPEMRKKGYKVFGIKHAHHDFEIDYPGKDSYRIFHSNANGVAIFNSSKIALIRYFDKEIDPLKIILNFFKDADIIFYEGGKNLKYPKIEITNDGTIFTKNPFVVILNGKMIKKIGFNFFYIDEIKEIANY
ncbi:MAG: molybdopterin-guanine dinucleotide biosynthesis protein B, partial [Candidatus Ratteibacteria bacterium]